MDWHCGMEHSALVIHIKCSFPEIVQVIHYETVWVILSSHWILFENRVMERLAVNEDIDGVEPVIEDSR